MSARKTSAAKRAADILTAESLSFAKRGLETTAIFYHQLANDLRAEDKERLKLLRVANLKAKK